jgi:hypothetical protein
MNILPHFGTMNVALITQDDIDPLRRSQEEGRTASGEARQRAVLRSSWTG